MKAALALIFFACVAGSMASDARGEILDQLVQQGQAIAQTVMQQLQSQLVSIAQQTLGHLSALVSSFGRFDFDFQAILSQIKPLIAGQINQVLSQILGHLGGLIGGRASFDFASIFQGLLAELTPAFQGIVQHVLNQGAAAVLGSLGSLTGSRIFGDIFATISSQFSNVVSAAQTALTGAIGNLTSLGSQILDASKPHWEQLQEQLVGHGLNVLGSISETVNNLHGTITGGR